MMIIIIVKLINRAVCQYTLYKFLKSTYLVKNTLIKPVITNQGPFTNEKNNKIKEKL